MTDARRICLALCAIAIRVPREDQARSSAASASTCKGQMRAICPDPLALGCSGDSISLNCISLFGTLPITAIKHFELDMDSKQAQAVTACF